MPSPLKRAWHWMTPLHWFFHRSIECHLASRHWLLRGQAFQQGLDTGFHLRRRVPTDFTGVTCRSNSLEISRDRDSKECLAGNWLVHDHFGWPLLWWFLLVSDLRSAGRFYPDLMTSMWRQEVESPDEVRHQHTNAAEKWSPRIRLLRPFSIMVGNCAAQQDLKMDG